MRLLFGLLGLAILAGCVSVNEVKGPDGKPAFAVGCGRATACYKKAGELCPDGYDFVDKNNSFTSGHFALQQHGGFKKGGKEIETVLHVRKVEVKELPPTK